MILHTLPPVLNTNGQSGGLVIDTDPVPDESWLKSDIQAWLTARKLDFPADAKKADLLDLVP